MATFANLLAVCLVVLGTITAAVSFKKDGPRGLVGVTLAAVFGAVLLLVL